MSLPDGTRLGTYEIIGQIGSGGMGDVYRATDPRLGRDIAIKTLPAAFASEEDRLARFEREAKLLAALNHPHIASIYSLDEYQGTLYLAMELVEGETLEEKLKPGAMPVEEALRLALQIAEGLEAAHEKGVVHRDLKPANVMVTPDGVLKVLDFGLAKAFSHEPEEASPGRSPALSLAMTQQGIILGTAGYMSPEQASGQATDQRADIWSFGVVVYEMLTGLPPFKGESVPHILADVLKSEPDWKRLPKNLHPRILELLERCLEKKPRNRYHSIADARIDIERTLRDLESAERTQAPSAPTFWDTRRLAVVTSLMVLAGAAAGVAVRYMHTPDSLPLPVTFQVEPPEGVALDLTIWADPFAISPDGRDLVFVGKAGGTRRLYLRPLSARDADARALSGTEGALRPFWSPDGEWVAFFEEGLLRRIRVAGGAEIVETISNEEIPLNGWGSRAWSANDQILLGGDRIVLISVQEGTVAPLIAAEDITDAKTLRWPAFLSDGERFLFVSEGDVAKILIGSIEGGATRELMEFSTAYGSVLQYVNGDVFYIDRGVLWARSFDEDTLAFSGGARRVVEGIPVSPFGSAPFSVSNNGVLAHRTLPLTEGVVFRWYERDGTPVGVVSDEVHYVDGFDLSPDGRSIALGRVVEDGAVELSLISVDTGARRQLIAGTLETVPRFSSDGTGLIFTARREGDPANPTRLYSISLRDENEELVLASDSNLLGQFWDVADNRVAYVTFSPSMDIWFKARREDEPTRLPLNTNFAERSAVLSQSHDLMAYTTDESGEPYVWIASYPEGVRLQQVSNEPSREPTWSFDGTELFYIGEDRMLHAVVVTRSTAGDIEVGPPEPLFRLEDAIDVISQADTVRRVFSVGPDGRFLVATRAPPEREPINITIGWEINSVP